MKVLNTAIPAVKIIEPAFFGDARGFFFESFNAERYAKEAGIEMPFVQNNHSFSTRDVLRGMHYQLERPQGKLVRVVSGAVYDVAVDLRASSTTCGRWVGVELSRENRRQLWIPPGFAHGFLVLTDSADVLYKTTEFYVPEDEYCLAWNDPDVAIEWPLHGREPTLSERDSRGLSISAVPRCR